jgi:hypothetical protein
MHVMDPDRVDEKSRAASRAGNAGAAMPADDRHTFTSGAMSSGRKPRYDLIPTQALRRIANRFEEGVDKYGQDNWRKGIHDTMWLLDRTNHAIEHLKKIQANLHSGLTQISLDDDAAAVAWAAIIIMEAESERAPKVENAPPRS